MSKDFFKYNQNNKEKLQKKLVKDMKVFLNQKKKNECGEQHKNLPEVEK